ncbi:CHAT domain-containing protein [Ephemerocybe angulata]|uniref:CHAT domain-containing protein n=1 Tax=Ephemerocybe angulata TaxID=980116 RepID=A0A8H6M8L9_9AGAR|nr:CHAT domain-containing protein [Tulosesus angulatus]
MRSHLMMAILTLFFSTAEVSDIDAAIEAQMGLVDLTPSDSPELPGCLHNLSMLWSTRFRLSPTFEPREYQKAILSLRRAIDFTAEDRTLGLAKRKNHLAALYFQLYAPTKAREFLDKGIALFKEAVDIAPDHIRIAGNLATALTQRAQTSRNLDSSDLEIAISALGRALDLGISPDPSLLSTALSTLGNAHITRFDTLGQLQDLEGGIAALRRAVAVAQEHAPDELASTLTNLGTALMTSFQYQGELSHLEEAISVTQTSILLTPDDSSMAATQYNNLGVMFHMHYPRVDKPFSDLEEAIEAGRKAVDLTSDSDPDKPARLHNLGTCYHDLFQRRRSSADLDECIALIKKAVKLTPKDHPMLAYRQVALANALHIGFAFEYRTIDDLDEAIRLGNHAIASSSRRPGYDMSSTYSLATYYQSRFEHTKNEDDIKESITLLRRVIELTSDTDAKRPNRLRELGTTLIAAYDATKDASYLEEAISAYKSSATLTFGPPAIRLQAARLWVQHATNQGDADSIIAAYDVTVQLLSETVGLEQTLEKRHQTLKQVSKTTLQAASAAFGLNRIDKALEWLEQGRCLVWNQLNNLRTPLTELQEQDADLAERVLHVSKSLEKAGMRDESVLGGVQASLKQKAVLQEDTLEHVQLAREWDGLLRIVRSIAGFEDFLRPVRASNLLENLPTSGIVIVINVSGDRCDAVALAHGQDPLHIPLEELSQYKASIIANHLEALLLENGIMRSGAINDIDTSKGAEETTRAVRPVKKPAERHMSIFDVLEELWRLVVKPIIDALDLKPSQFPGRIWWCPTGPLTALPIHAAGIYTSPTECCTLSDYAISSYTPTISSLTSIVKHKRTDNTSSAGLAMVALSDYASLPPLPGTMLEITAIQNQLSSHGVSQSATFKGENATREVTIQNMEQHRCIHLACHADQDALNPMMSGFELHDGRLELSTIIQSNLKHADLAFLSACQTSTGDAALSEEAVHLAAGMIAAGYRGVVATMWSIPDQYAPAIAEYFYEELLGSGERGRLDGSNAASALHKAVQRLREQLDNSPASFLAWVPYVHFGL